MARIGSTWSMQEARSRFTDVIEAARRAPQTVTRHGKPDVVVLDAAEYERLRQRQGTDTPSFIEALLAMPQDGGEFPRAHVRPRRF